MINEAFGWAWIAIGFVGGFLLGTRFHDDGFLGGYGSWARRLLRLGHIACVALGALNILFAVSAPRAALDPGWLRAASRNSRRLATPSLGEHRARQCTADP